MPLTYRGLVEETPLDFIRQLWTGNVEEIPRRRIIRTAVVTDEPFTESVDTNWWPVSSGSASDVSGTSHVNFSCTLNRPVAYGDVIIVGLTHGGTFFNPTRDSFSDNLGNTYVVPFNAYSFDATTNQSLSWAFCIVTNPGTPTITGFSSSAMAKNGIVAVAYRSSTGMA